MDDGLRRPTYLTPASLAVWLPKLYACGKQYKFYKTPEWKRLRRQVLEANHYECEDCRAQSPTKITRATTVHHDRETEKFPELALSLYWVDGYGGRHQNLFALCDDCHNRRHGRFGYDKKEKEAPLTEERW